MDYHLERCSAITSRETAMIWCQSFVMFFFIIKIVYITFICVILVWSFILGTLFSITWLQMVIRTLRNITCYQQTTTSRGVISVQGGSWVRPIFQCKVQILFSKLISLYWSYSNSTTWDTLQYVTKACRNDWKLILFRVLDHEKVVPCLLLHWYCEYFWPLYLADFHT